MRLRQSQEFLAFVIPSPWNWQDWLMGEEKSEGWFTDPFSRHEARWLTDGVPTNRVRDGRVEATDPVPDEPFSVDPVRIEYVERQSHPKSGGVFKSKGGIVVPGGIVTIEPHQGKNPQPSRATELLQVANPFGANDVKRDIVIWDMAHERELYRDGPYDAITVNRPLDRVVAEVKRDGVEGFLSRLGGGAVPPGTISVTRVTPNQVYERAALTGIEYYWERIARVFKRRR
jgi:hypothetical protein